MDDWDVLVAQILNCQWPCLAGISHALLLGRSVCEMVSGQNCFLFPEIAERMACYRVLQREETSSLCNERSV